MTFYEYLRDNELKIKELFGNGLICPSVISSYEAYSAYLYIKDKYPKKSRIQACREICKEKFNNKITPRRIYEKIVIMEKKFYTSIYT